MSYDRMVAALQEQKDFVPPTATDVLVCTLGQRTLLREKLALVKDLWSGGLSADIAHDATWVSDVKHSYGLYGGDNMIWVKRFLMASNDFSFCVSK